MSATQATPDPRLRTLLHQLWTHLGRRRRLQLLALLVVMLASSVAEVLSLAAVLPFLAVLPLPANTGLRQPIHATQLAGVALHFANCFLSSPIRQSLPDRIALGGDTTLTYYEMINALQQAQPLSDSARCCCLLFIPNRLFFFLAAPVLLLSPRAFEALLRMCADLSGFTSSDQILGVDPKPFPVLPLA